ARGEHRFRRLRELVVEALGERAELRAQAGAERDPAGADALRERGERRALHVARTRVEERGEQIGLRGRAQRVEVRAAGVSEPGRALRRAHRVRQPGALRAAARAAREQLAIELAEVLPRGGLRARAGGARAPRRGLAARAGPRADGGYLAPSAPPPLGLLDA